MKENELQHITQMVPLTEIKADADFNCRGDDITPQNVYELSQDIKKNGLLQPVVVGPVEADGLRRLIAGYRRFMAHKVLKREEIFCSIRDDMTDHNALLLMNLRENVQRVDLNKVQEAKALSRLLELGLTEEQMAKELNKSRGWVQIRTMIRALPTELHTNVLDGTFTDTNVRELYTSMCNDSRDTFIEKVKWLKNEKAKGKKGVTLKDRPKDEPEVLVKRVRSKEEMYRLQARIHTMFYTGHIAAVVIAWATGAITSEDLEASLKEECEKEAVEYKPGP